MKFETLEIKHENDVLNVTLNRPESLNAINEVMTTELIELADLLLDRDDIAFVVFRGKGRIFSAGADLKEVHERLESGQTPTAARSRQARGQELVRKLESIEQTVFAALHGSAYGAGLGVALTADFRIMANDAVMNVPETKIGMFYTYGITPRVTALIGPTRTKELIMFAEDISAQDCLSWGLATRVVDQKEVDSTVESMIETLRQRDRASLRVTKKIVRASTPTTGDLTTTESEVVNATVGSESENAISDFVSRK